MINCSGSGRARKSGTRGNRNTHGQRSTRGLTATLVATHHNAAPNAKLAPYSKATLFLSQSLHGTCEVVRNTRCSKFREMHGINEILAATTEQRSKVQDGHVTSTGEVRELCLCGAVERDHCFAPRSRAELAECLEPIPRAVRDEQGVAHSVKHENWLRATFRDAGHDRVDLRHEAAKAIVGDPGKEPGRVAPLLESIYHADETTPLDKFRKHHNILRPVD